MKKFFIYNLLAIASLLAVSSCTDDYDYTPAKPIVEGNSNVTFLTDAKRTALDIDENSFTIKVGRMETTGELTVPLVVTAPEVLHVPSSVTFADGESEAEIVIAIGDNAEMCKKYPLSISIPEEYTNPYNEENEGFVSFFTNVVKEDYKVVANGVFKENVLFGDEWEQSLEYSEIMDIYRLPDLIVGGTNFYFKWDGTSDEFQAFYFCDDEGNEVESMETGYVHPSYGMIMAAVVSGNFMGCEGDTFYFPLNFKVSAGSFGSGYDTYTITERLN